MRRRLVASISIFVLLILAFASILLLNRLNTRKRFIGHWSGGSYPAIGSKYPTDLVLNADGTYLQEGYVGQWHVEGGTLVLLPVNGGSVSRLDLTSDGGLSDGLVDGQSYVKK